MSDEVGVATLVVCLLVVIGILAAFALGYFALWMGLLAIMAGGAAHTVAAMTDW